MTCTCPRCGEACASERWARDHCKPSRILMRTGYRHDRVRHRAARYKLPASRRRAIARALQITLLDLYTLDEINRMVQDSQLSRTTRDEIEQEQLARIRMIHQ